MQLKTPYGNVTIHKPVLIALITSPSVQALKLKNGIWFFTDIESAKKLAKISLYLQQYAYTSWQSCLIYHLIAPVMRRALKIKLLSLDEIHFSTDKKVLEKLNTTKDKLIKEHMYKIVNLYKLYTKGTQENVKSMDSLQPLTCLDEKFAYDFNYFIFSFFCIF